MLLIACCWLAILAMPASRVFGQATRPAAKPPTANDLEQQFQKTMSGATLIGRFTVGPADANPKEERYTIGKVSKVGGDRWLIVSRIQFGGKDVSVPLFLNVKWAGDTPVIQVTDMTVPGLGTYTARVMVFKDQYAGTWSAPDHGGHLWGRIEKAKEEKPATQPAEKK
jgi:hypothetical protein